MPLKLVSSNHVELVGEGHVLLTSPHSTNPEAGHYAGQIVEDAALVSKAFAVIGKAKRDYADDRILQAATTEFSDGISELLDENDIRIVLDICGKDDPGVTVRAATDHTVSATTIELIKDRLSGTFSVVFKSDIADSASRGVGKGVAKRNHEGGQALETVRVEFGREELVSDRDKVVESIAELVAFVNAKLSSKGPSKERDRVKD